MGLGSNIQTNTVTFRDYEVTKPGLSCSAPVDHMYRGWGLQATRVRIPNSQSLITPLVQTWDTGKKTLSVLSHSFLLLYRANSVYILSISPLIYPRSLPWDEAKMRLLWHVLFHWRGNFHSFRPSGQNLPHHSNFSFLSGLTSWVHSWGYQKYIFSS